MAPDWEPKKTLDKETYTVYQIFGASGELLYVGVTGWGFGRVEQHRANRYWFKEAASATFEHYPDKMAALLRERAIIAACEPKYNYPEVTRGRYLHMRREAEAELDRTPAPTERVGD
jgi:hypothetical protein